MPSTQLTQSDRVYIQKQVAKMRSGYPADDCLWRIASCANLIGVSDQITDSNRAKIQAWIQRFESGNL